MWQSGEISDDQFKLTSKYLQHENSNISAVHVTGEIAQLCARTDNQRVLAFDKNSVERWPRLRRWLSEPPVYTAIRVSAILFVVLWGADLIVRDDNTSPAVHRNVGSSETEARLAAKVSPDPLRRFFLDEPVYRQLVRDTDYGAKWPFPAYRAGIVRCEFRTVSHITRPLVTIEFEGRVFGLNGAAKGWGGYSDSRMLMARHPELGTYELGASDRMIADALAKCG